MINMPSALFISCPKGLENLLVKELGELGAVALKVAQAGVHCEADIKSAYRICLWSRLANRVLLPLAQAEVRNTDDIYQLASDFSWDEHFTTGASLLVDFTGKHPEVRNSQYGAQRVKDGIVDQLRNTQNWRPSIDKKKPDIRVSAHVDHNSLTLSLDLSGESLHRRGYRQAQGAAPLKENLAAAILMRAGWPDFDALVDPMCGSGTLLIEAAFMAADIAPGLLRPDSGDAAWGFSAWQQHQNTLWTEIVDEAKARREQGLNELSKPIHGFDLDQRAVDFAEHNIRSAGLQGKIQLERSAVANLSRPASLTQDSGLIICNPPYGERLGEQEGLKADYAQLAKTTKALFPGWTLAIFTGNPPLARETRLRAEKIYKLVNARIASELLLYKLLGADKALLRRDQSPEQQGDTALPISPGMEMLVNRLRKNQKRLAPWLKKTGVSCYRLYDADMPEYAAAIDVYEGHLHIQEYAPPKTVDSNKAKRRWRELLRACGLVFERSLDDIAVKVRHRNPGKQQYQKLADNQSQAQTVQVKEGEARFHINLTDYLDTGLFLDHRPLRRMLYQQANGKSFLNLFCYTATVSVQAILGGARSSVSVDMSNTYLDWAARNYALNHIRSAQHQLVRADCVQWLRDCRQGFDLILLDPPSFSNSKKMTGVLDIQRDHVRLIIRCMELLNPGGELYFSCNLRSFKLDQNLIKNYFLTDISKHSLDPDFFHKPKIHYCWRIKHLDEK